MSPDLIKMSPDLIKPLFSIPDEINYLNVAGIGPLMKSVVEAGEAGIRIKATPWMLGEEEFFNQVDDARALFAELIGSHARDIAIVPSATYGVETAFLNTPLLEGDEILVQGEEFPSIVLPAQRACQKSGAVLKFVARPSDFDWTTALLDCVSEKTKVIAVSPCHWTDGSLLDLKRVGERAREVGALFLVDACQAVGALPININIFRPDFMVAPTYKWLLGPYALGFMYVSPRFQSGEALEQYWASREGARDFSKLTAYNPQYEEGALRFDMGERSQFINVPMAAAALKQILAWTPESIALNLKLKTDYLAHQALSLGYEICHEQFRSPHFIGLRRAQGFSTEFQALLLEHKIFISVRGDWLRVAPHLYNDKSDLDQLLNFL